ncbi:histidine phosphatase family protein [Haloarcula onubensis]|uniref:Histidine phosphatase family protein n=1 Tax=Haloarcula onubensis TaxID=2950539 RepID=A0ABU2FSD2_9EURY|nr:histidine phosphatase family protein [Halomicroarcula sp. S3CR25-11]MDS0283677.1 histidine phosphatase family protein [Halomicroarcula sp. S3CR25-11]
MADTVWVVRHGQRQDSVDPSWDDHADRVHDPPLTDLGRWAAWRTGRRFVESGVPLDAVYASPFLRTAETAEEIGRETGTDVYLEPGLGEHRNPEWFDADPETVPAEHLADWFDPITLDHDPYLVPEFPESGDEAMARAGNVARQLAADVPGTVLLVGHGLTVGGVVDGLVGSTDGVDAPLCGVTRLDRDRGNWELAFSGDTTHLDV